MIKWNWNPDPDKIVFVDVETQSVLDVTDVGSDNYTDHPSTRIGSLVAMVPMEPKPLMYVWIPAGRAPEDVLEFVDNPSLYFRDFDHTKYNVFMDIGGECPDALRYMADEGYTFVAHNATFDALMIERATGINASWYDTYPMAKAASLHGSLGKIGAYLFNTPKGDNRAMKMLTKADIRGGKVLYKLCNKHTWADLLYYNIGDVLILSKLFNVTLGEGESDVLDVHTTINERGIYVDFRLMETLMDLYDLNVSRASKRMHTLLDDDDEEINLASPQQIKKWLTAQGLKLPNNNSLDQRSLTAFFNEPEDYFENEMALPDHISKVIEALRLRQMIVRSSRSKLTKIMKVQSDVDGRCRQSLVYYGAHTGRWSGRGLNPHNFPRGNDLVNVEGLIERLLSDASIKDKLKFIDAESARVEEVSQAMKRASWRCSPADVLGTLMRPVVRAADNYTFGIVDYAAIEARGVAWISDEVELLDMFQSWGREPYLEMASKVYGRTITKKDTLERFVGKQIILGCGYGMAWPKFNNMCKMYNVDLIANGVNPQHCIEVYRKSFPNIAHKYNGVWKQLQTACHNAINTRKTQYAAKCEITYRGSSLFITLPSGRSLHYRNAKIEDLIPKYCAIFNLPIVRIPTITFDHPMGWRAILYGGLITENAVQGISRDVLATALVRCEWEGLNPVLHVHDEIIGEHAKERAVEKLRQQCIIMSEVPDWAKGFPIAVKGFLCDRYVKEPYKNSVICEAMNGAIR